MFSGNVKSKLIALTFFIPVCNFVSVIIKVILRFTSIFSASNEEISNLAGFLATPHLLNTSTVRQKKKKKTSDERESWKPSKVEAREGFIKHIKADTEISQAVEHRLALLQKKGVPSQPYIMVVGESLDKINTYLIIVNKFVIYERLSVMHAIDTCYKMLPNNMGS